MSREAEGALLSLGPKVDALLGRVVRVEARLARDEPHPGAVVFILQSLVPWVYGSDKLTLESSS